MSDPNCIFCKIASGDIPAWKLYEDEHVLSFLDIGPLSEGHCLIIPKRHYVTIDEMPAEEAAACMAVVPKLSRAVMDSVDAKGWNVLQNNGRVSGQAVDHVHIHIIPRNEGDGLGFRWPAGSLDDELAQRLQQSITQKLD